MAVKLHPVCNGDACTRQPEAVLTLVADMGPSDQVGEFYFDDEGRLWNSIDVFPPPTHAHRKVYHLWCSWNREWEEVQGEEFEF